MEIIEKPHQHRILDAKDKERTIYALTPDTSTSGVYTIYSTNKRKNLYIKRTVDEFNKIVKAEYVLVPDKISWELQYNLTATDDQEPKILMPIESLHRKQLKEKLKSFPKSIQRGVNAEKTRDAFKNLSHFKDNPHDWQYYTE